MENPTYEMNYLDRRARLEDEDLQIWLAEEDIDPAEYLNLNVPRIDKCEHPVWMDKTNIVTGETTVQLLPCNSANADKCEECSEFRKRLRTRQMLNHLEQPKVLTAFMTLTEPSNGKVHRSQWTQKDDFKYRRLEGEEAYANKLSVMAQREPCSCGGRHQFDDGLDGTPVTKPNANGLELPTYNYVRQVVFSHNLPALMKSTVRHIRAVAANLGIEPEALSLFAVFERQKRGSLHAHFLVCVKDDPTGFYALVSAIKTDWKSPTAKIPDRLVARFMSPEAQERLDDIGVKNVWSVAKSIPKVMWRANGQTDGELVYGTKWGKVADIRILNTDDENGTEITSQKQASNYLAKYLAKGSSKFSTVAISRLTGSQKHHAWAQRHTAVALLADVIVWESRAADLRRSLGPDAGFDGTEFDRSNQIRDRLIYPTYFYGPAIHRGRALQALTILESRIQLAALENGPITNSAVVDELIEELKYRTLTRSRLSDVLSPFEVGESRSLLSTNQTMPVRSLKIRLNKLADNAGFTGTQALVHNWVSSLTSIIEEMREWAEAHSESLPKFSVTEDEVVWTLNPGAMEAERVRRVGHSPLPPWVPRGKESFIASLTMTMPRLVEMLDAKIV